MPTTYTDQFFVIDPYSGLTSGVAMPVVKYDMIDQDDNGFIDTTGGGDTVNGLPVTRVWVNDTVTVTMGGVTVTITGVTFYVTGGPAIFTPTDGTILSDAVFVSSTGVTSSTQIAVGAFGPPCFTKGTMIETEDGPCAIETLQEGDMIWTQDNGFQPVLMIERQTVAGTGKFAPIRFCKGSIGNEQELLVSPNHRILITGWQAELYYGMDEVLVAAKHLVNGDTIYAQACDEVEYIHLLFSEHEIVMGQGVRSESYLPSTAVVRSEMEVNAEILEIFPDITVSESSTWQMVRPELKKHEAVLLAA